MIEHEMKNENKEIWKLFKETDKRFKETDKKFQETDKKFQETDRQFKKRFNDLERLFTGQWGKLMEALVAPGLLKLFRDRGVNVHQIFQRIENYRNGDKMEIDLLLANDSEVIAVEVKTTLKTEDVRDFLLTLSKFMDFFPRYKGCRLYGAVSGLDIQESSDRYAYKQGLFVLKVGKEGLIEIVNDEKFKPKNFVT